jgi:dihydroorotate dehydrogenase electron transfer subunit
MNKSMPSSPQEPLSPQRILASVLTNDTIIPNHKVIACIAPEIASVAQPGHFVSALVTDGFDPFLRKPFSIYTVDRERGEITLLYSIVGGTTKGMAKKRAGDTLDIVGPLGGKIFRPDPRPDTLHIMVGGGYGVPPLVFLSRELRLANPDVNISFLIGARKKELLLCESELLTAGIDARMATEDGSHDVQGRVTDVLLPLLEENAGKPVTVYCCGPTPMMHAVGDLCIAHNVPCQVSMEVSMPCGVGVCMACVIDLSDGRRVRCCTDGPVFGPEEVTW